MASVGKLLLSVFERLHSTFFDLDMRSGPNSNRPSHMDCLAHYGLEFLVARITNRYLNFRFWLVARYVHSVAHYVVGRKHDRFNFRASSFNLAWSCTSYESTVIAVLFHLDYSIRGITCRKTRWEPTYLSLFEGINLWKILIALGRVLLWGGQKIVSVYLWGHNTVVQAAGEATGWLYHIILLIIIPLVIILHATSGTQASIETFQKFVAKTAMKLIIVGLITFAILFVLSGGG